MNFTLKQFDELTAPEVYNILAARCEVFIVEQNCPYLDPDGLDLKSLHLFTHENGRIAGYCRITPPDTRFPETSIGRLIVTEKFRKTGLGRKLMLRAIEIISSKLHDTKIRISGQAYLRKFYESLGFEVCSEEYLEDGIPHYEFFREEKP